MPQNERYVGIIAQNMKGIAPYMIDLQKNMANGKSYYTYNANALRYMTVNAIKEQQKQIENLEGELEAHKNEQRELRAELSNFKERFNSIFSNGTMSSDNGKSSDNKKTVTLKGKEVTERALLYQNKPNPFSGNTTIKYYLPEKVVDAQLIIISSETGKLLKRVSLEKNGFGEVELNTKNVAAGNYTYSLILDGEEALSRQMVLTK